MKLRWLDGDTAELRRRHMAGESFGAIAYAMGKPRSAVAGKLKRLGLSRVNSFRPTVKAKYERGSSPTFGTLTRYVATREPAAAPVREMTKREIEADFASIWANTVRLPVPPAQSPRRARPRREKTPVRELVLADQS